MIWRAIRRFWTASISRQLILGIALVHAVLMTIFVFDLVSRQGNFLVEESRQQAMALADTLAANGTSWVIANDFVGIEEVIESQSSYPGLRYAMFIDRGGQVLGYTDRAQVGQYVSDAVSRRLLEAPPEAQLMIDDRMLIDVAQPIMAGDRHVGWARVGVSREGIAANLHVITGEGLAYTAAAIAIGVLFAWVMGKGLTRDIHRLAGFAHAIGAGERTDRVILDRPDELGQLSQDMNEMLETLVARERELAVAHAQILADEERLRYALEGSNDGLWDWDIPTNEVYLSPRWKEMLGYGDDEFANAYESWQRAVHPADLPGAMASLQGHLQDAAKSFEILHRLRHKDGSWRWMLSRGVALRDTDGNPYRMVGTHVDVTDQKQLEETLSAERERALVTLHSIGDAVITTFADGAIDMLNPVAEQLTGWSSHDAHLRPIREVFAIVDEVSRSPLPDPVMRCLRQGIVVTIKAPALLIHREGWEVSIEDSAAPIRDSTGRITGAVLVFHDVTESRKMQRELEQQARQDSLTGLLSRVFFDHRLAEATEEALQGLASHILVYIDLDQFKIVNDTAGHIAGDELLKQVAVLLRKHIRESDLLARLGGDEFGLLLVGCPLEQGVRVADEMRRELSEFRFTWRDQQFQLGASIGITVIDRDLADRNALSLADLACYTAKEQGRNRVHVYHPGDRELSQRRTEMQWVARIKSAISENRFVLYSQRIVPLNHAAPTREFREILVRMQDEDGRIVPPGQFIPAAERYDVMSDIDRLVIRDTCEWLRAHTTDNLFVSVNLSGGSLSNRSILDAIEEQLDELPELARHLCFEITETAAVGNLSQALDFIGRLKRKGVSFALDDFGSGLSSFSYLKTLPVDYLKIDGSFVRDLLDDPVDSVMIESISRVSKVMGIETIAEFVENEATLERLRDIGVDFAQGFAIEKPGPLHDL